MRIDRMFLDGFGHFNQRNINFDHPITIISGANEAGKTTILEFIRTILFGFLTKQSDNKYRPLSGGNHGGRLFITTDSGQQYTIQRTPGGRRGRVIINGPEGSPVAESMLPTLIGHSSEYLFKNVFAFSLTELQNMDSLNNEEVSGRIYSAGMGAANLPSVQRQVETDGQKIFSTNMRSNSRNQVAETLSELQEVENQLREFQNQAQKYGENVSREDRIREQLKLIGDQRKTLSARSVELTRLQSAWHEWRPMRAVEVELADLPDLADFPLNAVGRLDELEKQIQTLAPEVQKLTDSFEQSQLLAKAEIPDEATLNDAHDLELIHSQRGKFDDSVRDLPERQAELQGFENELDQSLNALGADWDEERLDGFDTSVGVHNDVKKWRDTLSTAEKSQQELRSELRHQQETERDISEAFQDSQTILENTPTPDLPAALLDEHEEALGRAKPLWDDLRNTRQRLTTLEDQLSTVASPQIVAPSGTARILMLTALLVVAGIAGVIAGLVEEQQLLTVAGIVMSLSGIILYFLSRPANVTDNSATASPLQNQINHVRSEESKIESALNEYTRILGLTNELDSSSLPEIEIQLKSIRAALQLRSKVEADLSSATTEADRQSLRVSDAQQALDQSLADTSSLMDAWRTWLDSKELESTLTPEAVGQLLERIETARAKRNQVIDRRDRVRAIQDDIQQFRELVEPVAAKHMTIPEISNLQQWAVIADDMRTRLESAQKAMESRRAAQQDAANLVRSLESANSQLQKAEQDRDSLIAQGKATDSEDLTLKAGIHQRIQEIERQIGDHHRRLRDLCLPDEPMDTLLETLSNQHPQVILEEQASAKESMAGLETDHTELSEELGQTSEHLKILASREEASELRAQREALKEKLQRHAAEWSKYTLASAILKRTREKYEKERQPEIIKSAEKFFSTITGDRYQRLMIPLGSKNDVRVEEENGNLKIPDQLSRGTQEQLYLAMRFGFIQEQGNTAERLPVVVDEVLVNFDADRKRRAVEAFVSLSETNQVLVFTCHPDIEKLFTDIAPGTQVINLDEMTA